MSIFDAIKKAKSNSSASGRVQDVEVSKTPLLDKLVQHVSEMITSPWKLNDPSITGKVLLARVRHANEEYHQIVEGDEIDKREAEAIEEGKKYLARLPAGVRANIECQLGRKLG